MEKRIGIVAVVVEKRENIGKLNAILSEFNQIIISRLGLPLKDKAIHVISLVVEGNTDQIGSMTGKIGRLDGIQVKSVLTKYKEPADGEAV